MASKLRSLFQDTAIYGVSTILARGINYLLVPFYANLLSTGDNGVQGILYANIALVSILFSYGMESAYMKFASEVPSASVADSLVASSASIAQTLNSPEPRQASAFTATSAKTNAAETEKRFGTPMWSLLASSLVLTALIAFIAPALCGAMNLPEDNAVYVRYAAAILFLDTITLVPMARLRLERQAIRFAAIRLLNVGATVVLSITLVVFFSLGLHGVFLANIAGSFAALLLLLPSTLSSMWSSRFTFSFPLWREMLRFGLPYIPAGIAASLIDFIDRAVLIRLPDDTVAALYGSGLTGKDLVGIYSRIYALGILVQLLVQVFRFAWQPFFLQHARDRDAPALFSRVMTLSVGVIIAASLAASLFVPELIEVKWFGRFYILPPPFWRGLPILPLLYLSFVFDMMYANLMAGFVIEKQTKYLPVITAFGAVATVGICLTLVPQTGSAGRMIGGMMGAAIATMCGSLVMAVAGFFYARRIYPVPYEWRNLLVMLTSAVIFYSIALYLPPSLLTKAALLLLFVLTIGLLFRDEAKTVLEKLNRR